MLFLFISTQIRHKLSLCWGKYSIWKFEDYADKAKVIIILHQMHTPGNSNAFLSDKRLPIIKKSKIVINVNYWVVKYKKAVNKLKYF